MSKTLENQTYYFNASNAQICSQYIPVSYLVTIEWVDCDSNSELYFGINDCPTKLNNVRSTIKKNKNLQYLTIFPNEISSCKEKKNFIFGIRLKGRCSNQQAAITITKINNVEVELDSPISDSLLPNVERFLHFKFLDSVFENPILIFRKLSEEDSIVNVKKNGWTTDSSNRNDIFSFKLNQFSISPIKKGDEFYFHLISNYSTPYTFFVRAGSICARGCLNGGDCNFETGKCNCLPGFWGKRCGERGCIEGSSCSVVGGVGTIKCTNKQDEECIVTYCDSWRKNVDNRCIPILYYEAAIAIIISLALIFLLTGCTVGLIIGKYTKKRTSYQVLQQ
eukprot:gene316-6730_t